MSTKSEPTAELPPTGASPVPDVNETLSSFELKDTQSRSLLERVVDGTVSAAGVAIIGTMSLLVFGNALSRYMLNISAIWADELVVSLMPWLAMCGVYLSIRRREMIRIDYFVLKMPPRLQKVIVVGSQIFSAAAFAYLAIGGLQMLNLFGSDRTLYLDLPTGWFTSALSVGAALVVVAFIIEILRDVFRKG